MWRATKNTRRLGLAAIWVYKKRACHQNFSLSISQVNCHLTQLAISTKCPCKKWQMWRIEHIFSMIYGISYKCYPSSIGTTNNGPALAKFPCKKLFNKLTGIYTLNLWWRDENLWQRLKGMGDVVFACKLPLANNLPSQMPVSFYLTLETERCRRSMRK